MVQSDTGLGAREHSERAHNGKKEPHGGAETGRGDFGYAPAYPKSEECSRSEHDEASCRGDDEAMLLFSVVHTFVWTTKVVYAKHYCLYYYSRKNRT